MQFLSGSATAMITPFDQSGVNFRALGDMIDYQLDGGTDALVFLGTTGEPATMTEREKEELISFAVRYIRKRAKVIVGTGSNCTERAVRASIRAEELGADGLLAVTPYYNKCTQSGLVAYYSEICAAVSIPVIAYHVPARTGVEILPKTAERLATQKNFAGIKEAGGDMSKIMETARLIRGKCELYSGEDLLNLPILAAGGSAVISVISNLAPKEVKALVSAVQAQDLGRANAIADRLLPLTKACFSEVNPIPVKEGLRLLGFEAGFPRPPLTRIEPYHRQKLKNALKELGLEAVK